MTRPKDDNELTMVNAIERIPPVSDEQKDRAALHAAVWCTKHTEEPASALREILQQLGLVPPDEEEAAC